MLKGSYTNTYGSLAHRVESSTVIADQSHFSRTFRLLTGITPSGYRALFRRG